MGGDWVGLVVGCVGFVIENLFAYGMAPRFLLTQCAYLAPLSKLSRWETIAVETFAGQTPAVYVWQETICGI